MVGFVGLGSMWGSCCSTELCVCQGRLGAGRVCLERRFDQEGGDFWETEVTCRNRFKHRRMHAAQIERLLRLLPNIARHRQSFD